MADIDLDAVKHQLLMAITHELGADVAPDATLDEVQAVLHTHGWDTRYVEFRGYEVPIAALFDGDDR